MTMGTAGNCLGALITVTVLYGACSPVEQSDPSQASLPCTAPLPEAGGDLPEGVVIVAGAEAPCEVVFTPVLTLTGDPQGVLPKLPVVAAPGGGWLTATFTDGILAFWSPSGEFQGQIGRGAGSGPGEFQRVSDLVVDSLAGTVHVFTGSPLVDTFSLDGEWLGQVRLPGRASRGTLLSNGTIATTIPAPAASKLVLVRPDTVLTTGSSARGLFSAQVRPGGEDAWTAEGSWYQIDHHSVPSGQVNLSIRRNIGWFPEPSEEEAINATGPQLMAFTIDPERRLVFALIMPVDDPDAPASPISSLGASQSREETRERNRRYFDAFVEVFSFDGQLVASSRFDSPWDTPNPIGGGSPGNLWYRIADDVLESIELLRPELVERASTR